MFVLAVRLVIAILFAVVYLSAKNNRVEALALYGWAAAILAVLLALPPGMPAPHR